MILGFLAEHPRSLEKILNINNHIPLKNVITILHPLYLSIDRYAPTSKGCSY